MIASVDAHACPMSIKESLPASAPTTVPRTTAASEAAAARAAIEREQIKEEEERRAEALTLAKKAMDDEAKRRLDSLLER